jgi:diguanylate cyclase (GGDEF)-like protein
MTATAAAVAVAAVAVVVAAVLAVVAVRRGQRLAAANAALVALARSMTEEGGSREQLVAATRRIAGAAAVVLAEPDGRESELRVTASTVPELLDRAVPLDATFPAVEAYHEDRVVHVADGAVAPGWPDATGATVTARSGDVLPVHHGGHVVGVLALVWKDAGHVLAPERTEVVALVAAEAGRAIERDVRYNLLARQARTDELTALPNRRAWDEAVERELSRAQRTGLPLCLALLDLDHFKAYNDTFGHQAGDTHLRRTAAAWRRELRTVDVLARYGGEEFGILLPDTPLSEASDAIDRVRAATPHEQTASAGVVQWDGHESADALLARADAALYRAKRAGRALTLSA